MKPISFRNHIDQSRSITPSTPASLVQIRCVYWLPGSVHNNYYRSLHMLQLQKSLFLSGIKTAVDVFICFIQIIYIC